MKDTDKIKITGGKKLHGSIKITGAKNSALPLVITSILTSKKLILSNVPSLTDMETIYAILEELGVKITQENDVLTFDGSSITNFTASYDLVSSMRASVLILGPLLARFHKAVVPLPGGCSIGLRPVDLHISALEKMGATIKMEHGNIVAEAERGLVGAEITFDKVSVGATENILMAATLAKGKTKLINVAREPEIVDLANCLIKMGAKITGAGSSVIEIEGVEALHGAEHRVIADRIQAGSYAIAALATGGEIILENLDDGIWGNFLEVLAATGAEITNLGGGKLQIKSSSKINAVDITTAPFPLFPTDLQSPFMALMSIAAGKSVFSEKIFENRFSIVPELKRMGANITIVDSATAIVEGAEKLYSAEVKATDLRSAFCLIIAGLVASGETIITELHHLDRGYVDAVENLLNLGADIKRGVNI
ncbi:MAG: UDP-N-acetylglucosamine 1-carboxyvinyltransferase [Alphaproteobacteria bacterium]|jgi:UDP-N-acetylglucosamine 1-carboxyvinyltransferase|nr:UDP-N-acetylglucosamine 1-carboxyvinyltransferase [Alphaproteobacteria bacterium]